MRLLHYHAPVPNFGDDLNPMLWPALAPALFEDRRPDRRDGDAAAFVGVGTIVGIDPGESRVLHVFSSGAGYSPLDRWHGRDLRYHCVRGPVTARLLGLDADRALTDGAILAPLVDALRPAPGAHGGGTVVVPHFETIAFPGWRRAVAAAGFALVDPRGGPAEVIAALAGADLVLTESLHGAILADSFGVPWRAFTVSRNFSTAKWADWSASLGMQVDVTIVPPPDPLPLLRFGKPAQPFGTALRLDPEAALREFRERVGPASQISRTKRLAKRVLERSAAARRLLGFGPERTAQALVELSRADPFVSIASRRESLRDEMLCRLDALVRSAVAAPVA